MKYLITGLGNFGSEYLNTRHNAGFMILDALALASNIDFEDKRFGFISRFILKGRSVALLKPTTFVNLSGRAVHYWMKKEKVPLENLLVVVDDIALPFGILRLRPKGGDGGHNGLAHISQIIGTQHYARLRFGIGNEYTKGRQVRHVLGEWTEEEKQHLQEYFEAASNIIRSFVLMGLEKTMNTYN